jgi:DNA processing protein
MYYHECSDFDRFLLRLSLTQGIGIKGQWQAIKNCLSDKDWQLSAETMVSLVHPRFEDTFCQSWQRLTAEMLATEIGNQPFITFFSEEYPPLLRKIADPPLILFYHGDLSLLQNRALAFVGARQATSYGRQMCRKIIPELIRKEFVIISGLAKGLDSFAHEAAIDCAGQTIAVVGTGLDQCYPESSRTLYTKIKENHLLLSEYPQGTKAKKHHFPMRNRLIAGIAQGVCVIEAKEQSGSLITAQLALENGKEIFAVPGEAVTNRSKGCHRLIQDGAKCTLSVEDILEELS